MDCLFQPDLTIDDWVNDLLEPLNGSRYPLSGSIELTERCNLSCVHCYINQSAADFKVKSAELDTNQWKEILNQMAEAGCLFLVISGGEPLLRDDFAEIFIHARKCGMLVTLFSNATLITPKIADLFAEWNLHSLEVSLYGATQETYENVTRRSGTLERCIRGIELALARDIKVNLKSVILKLNQHELELLKKLTADYGSKFRYDYTLWPRLDGGTSNLQYQISSEKMLALDVQDPQRLESWQETAEKFNGVSLRGGKVFNCGAAFRSFHIDAYGQINPCMMVRRPHYGVLDVAFVYAWKKLGEVRNMLRILNTECETCPIGALCRQCPGWSLAVHGDYETPVSEICEMSKSRAAEISLLQI